MNLIDIALDYSFGGTDVARALARHIATRYDKLAETFMGFVKLACIMLWLK